MNRAADLVLSNGRIVTLDPDDRVASAIAFRGAWIVGVGEDEVEALRGPQTREIDLAGRMAVPGFIEGHGHFMSLGEAKSILDLTVARNWEEIVGLVAQAAEQLAPGDWIEGRGWHQEKWDRLPNPSIEGSPVHSSLSEVTQRNPVRLEHASGHATFVNGLAMQLAGISRNTPDPEGGEIVRDPEGRPTGLLRENAQELIGRSLDEWRRNMPEEARWQQKRRWVELAGREALMHGVTSFHDAGVSFETIDFYRDLEASGSLPIRLYVMVREAPDRDMEEKLPQIFMPAEGDDYLAVRAIKRQIDGALGSHGAWLLEPYTDLAQSSGLVVESRDMIRRTAELARDHGFQLATHAIGDRANREVLDIYASFLEPGERGRARRWRIEHAQHLSPTDVGRFADLGVIAAMQGTHCTSDAPWIPKRLGEARAESGAYLWRRLLDSGAVIGNGTDVPVERIDPIASFYASVTRRTADGNAFFPGQAMTRLEALRSYTVANAFAAFEEGLKGSLEVGKLADMVVLSEDLLAVDEGQIPDTRVDITILGGVIRYERQTDAKGL